MLQIGNKFKQMPVRVLSRTLFVRTHIYTARATELIIRL